jgi:hypothetical protein
MEMAPIYGTDKVLLFGGYINLDDTWVYDLSDNNWTFKSPKTKPPGRYFQSMSPIHGSDKVVMFGGIWSNNDTWVFDLTKEKWTKISLKNKNNKPGPVYAHGMAPINGTNKVILYGPVANDTWIYQHDLFIRNGTYISEPFDTGANSSFHEIIWNRSTLENTSIKFQLRTGATEAELTSGPFIGPEGTTTTYYSSSPSDLWQGHFGDQWVQFKAFFTMNVYTDPPELKEITIKYNGLPGIIVISPSNGTLLTKNKPKFTWTFIDYDSEYQHAFHVLIDDDINFTSVDYDSGIQNTSKQHWDFPLGTNYTELSDGTLYWKVHICDADGVWTDYSQPRVLRIDTHTPTSAPAQPVNNGYYNSLDIISGIANDQTNGSGVAKVEINVKRLSDNTFWDGNEWVQLPTWIITTGTTAWTYDSSTVLWDSGRKYSIQSRAIDIATNIEDPGDGVVFSIDKDEPLTNIEIPMDNVWLNQLDTISGTSLDISGSGIEKVEISIICTKDYINWDSGPLENNYWDGTNWISTEIWLPTTGTNLWSYDNNTILWTTGDHYTIRSRATDKTSNVESPGPGHTFMYDDKPPENLEIFINNKTEYTKSTSINLLLSAEDVGSGISQMAFSTDENKWTGWEPFESEHAFTLPTIDGEKSVFFRVMDNAGNIAEAIFDSIVLDTTPPEDLKIIINNDDEFSNKRMVTLELNAIDILSGLDEMSFSIDGLTWMEWEHFTNERVFTLPPMDGEKLIYFRVSDIAGNIAKSISDTIIMDTTPPQSLSIIVDGGEPETRLTLVVLELNAEDTISGVDKIAFSSEKVSWSEWDEYSKIKYFDLPPGEGMKTIYFRAMDRAGNIAELVSATIFLNTTPEETSSPEKTSSSQEASYFPYIFLIIIFLIVMTALWFVISMKRMKRIEQKLLPAAITVKPPALPGTTAISQQVPAAPTTTMLPGTTATTGTDIQQPTISVVPIPMLEKTTQISAPKTTGTTPITSPAQTPQLPQLPPAPAQVTDSKLETTESKPAPDSPIITPTPTLSSSPTVQAPEVTTPVIGHPQPQGEVKEEENSK